MVTKIHVTIPTILHHYLEVNLQGLELANLLVNTIIDKKASNILLLDVHEQAIFTDYFILCNGDSNRQLQALLDGVAEAAKHKGDTLPIGIEGQPESGWVLADFGEVIVHFFSPEKRTYYKLEELWSQSRVVLRIQ